MANLDLTKVNIAIDRLFKTTSKPRHQFLLKAYSRHRYLEIAGRFQEIFAPEMMVDHPVYHFRALGIDATLDGREAIQGLYSMWTATNQCIFYAENEQVAVADTFTVSTAITYQQVQGKALAANGVKTADPNSMYLYKNQQQMIWHYDDKCRLIGEDVWEVNPSLAEIIKLAPKDVVTVAQAAEKLKRLIKPLPKLSTKL
ncbi:MAG: hypothetical protein QOD75_177 [Blastocatellia bacterium]|jgi:hypothetical protein|nr:hypothetical protein [Blastocatellia bacterium]